MFVRKEMKNSLYIIAALFLASCTSDPQVGQYVYRDAYGTIHADRDCKALTDADAPRTKEERIANRYGVVFVDTCDLSFDTSGNYGGNKYCPRCVNDEAYKHLLSIIERNEKDKSK